MFDTVGYGMQGTLINTSSFFILLYELVKLLNFSEQWFFLYVGIIRVTASLDLFFSEK